MASAPGEVLAIVPARGGSRGIPRKNLAQLAGRPLLAWAIAVAREVPAIGRVIVSTDDDEIARVAQEQGAEVDRRPPELATDSALVIDALRELLGRLRAAGTPPRVVVVLEPTCPLRSGADVHRCLEVLDRHQEVDSVATYTAAALNPMRAWRIEDGLARPFLGAADPWLPRQLLPEAYQLNGAVYAFRAERLGPEHRAIVFGTSAAVLMPRDRSVDVDEPIDLLVAEAVLAAGVRA